MAAPAAVERSLQETPTWAVALVCAVFVIVSVLIEHGIESLAKWFKKKQKKAMSEALEKIKAELMLLGFISLLLTIGTRFIAKICIPAELGSTMLPCKRGYKDGGGYGGDDGGGDDGGDGRRKLLSYAEEMILRRVLAAQAGGDYCSKSDKIPLISQTGVHQLHIFIFMLALFHVLYSVMTMALAQAKMKKWKSWESETSSLEYEFTNDPARFRFAHQTSFVRRHAGFSRAPGIRWIVAFFRQFFASVTKVDYTTMRRGFINAHLAPNSKFNFHKYIKRSMEDDFKVVVGIRSLSFFIVFTFCLTYWYYGRKSMPLWIFAIIFMLLNVYKWYTLSWMQIVPVTILLVVGTKLELIIMEMAEEIQDRTTVVKGAPIVEPNNKFFWFNRPHWVLLLIHFILFQNAFQMSFFLWITYEYGIKSCFHENLAEILVRLFCGVALQILCSYITFPLYALVTQMGSHMKKSIFEEQTAQALKKWQKAAKERKKLRKAGGDIAPGSLGGENTPTHGPSSPLHLLRNHKYRSSTNEVESAPTSPKSYQSDTDLSDMEGSSRHGHHQSKENDHLDRNAESHSIDFSFSKA